MNTLTVRTLDSKKFALVDKENAVYPGGMLFGILKHTHSVVYVYNTRNARHEIIDMRTKKTLAIQIEF